MRVPSSYRRKPLAFNMTPMIDVVFLLIVFFLVSSHLVRQEAQLPLELPRAESGPTAVDEEGERIIVNVLPQGRILLAGAPVNPQQLQQRLAARLERFREEHRSRDDLEVRIRSDRSVPYANIEPILLACARAGVWNVTFAVYRQEGER